MPILYGLGELYLFLWVKGNVEEIILSCISCNLSDINDYSVCVLFNEYK